MRYCDDGRLKIDNNAAERALRAVALDRKNYLLAGSDRGGESAAAIYSLIGTAKINGIDPEIICAAFCPAWRNIQSTVSRNLCPGTYRQIVSSVDPSCLTTKHHLLIQSRCPFP